MHRTYVCMYVWFWPTLIICPAAGQACDALQPLTSASWPRTHTRTHTQAHTQRHTQTNTSTHTSTHTRTYTHLDDEGHLHSIHALCQQARPVCDTVARSGVGKVVELDLVHGPALSVDGHAYVHSQRSCGRGCKHVCLFTLVKIRRVRSNHGSRHSHAHTGGAP
jgi:hypothetical protein